MTPATPPPRLAVMVFPMDFPIKVMGAQVAGFVEAIEAIALAFDPKYDRSTNELRTSSTGKYLVVTITIQATSQDMLDRSEEHTSELQSHLCIE